MSDSDPSGSQYPTSKNGWFATFNQVFDRAMEELSPIQFMVFFHIYRKTLGWRKRKDKISVSQLLKQTQLSERSIYYAIEILEQLDWIKVWRSSGKSSEYGVSTSVFREMKRIWKDSSARPLQNLHPFFETPAKFADVTPETPAKFAPPPLQNLHPTTETNTTDINTTDTLPIYNYYINTKRGRKNFVESEVCVEGLSKEEASERMVQLLEYLGVSNGKILKFKSYDPFTISCCAVGCIATDNGSINPGKLVNMIESYDENTKPLREFLGESHV